MTLFGHQAKSLNWISKCQKRQAGGVPRNHSELGRSFSWNRSGTPFSIDWSRQTFTICPAKAYEGGRPRPVST